MNAVERLYLNAAKSRVVREGDPAAAFLLAGKGLEIPAKFLPLVAQMGIAASPAATNPQKIEDRSTRIVKNLREK
jgi:hypothetical protein